MLRTKKWMHQLAFLGAITLFISGCGANEEENETINQADNNTENEVQEEDVIENSIEENEIADAPSDSFPVTLTDNAEREVTIEEEPESIISIQASNTEILFALDAGDRVIGVSDFDNYPEEVMDIEKVGAQDMNAELILSLEPDLILATQYHYSSHEDILNEFIDAGIDVLIIDGAGSFGETYDSIRLIGDATGTRDNAEAIIVDMEDRLSALEDLAQTIPAEDRKTVWVEIAPSPDIYTAGTGTFINEMLEAIHAVNAAGELEGWAQVTEEEAVQYNPDVIITTYGDYVENPVEEVTSRDGWDQVAAVSNEQVFNVESDPVSRPGPRLIEGVESLAEVIYPEIFE